MFVFLQGRRRLAGSNFGEEEELMRIEADGAIFTESNLTVRDYAVLQDTDVFGKFLPQMAHTRTCMGTSVVIFVLVLNCGLVSRARNV